MNLVTFYLLGAVISLTLIYLLFTQKKEALKAKHTKAILIATTIILTLSSWIFILLVIYKRLKRRFAKEA